MERHLALPPFQRLLYGRRYLWHGHALVLHHLKTLPTDHAASRCVPRMLPHVFGLRYEFNGSGALQATDWLLGQRNALEAAGGPT